MFAAMKRPSSAEYRMESSSTLAAWASFRVQHLNVGSSVPKQRSPTEITSNSGLGSSGGFARGC